MALTKDVNSYVSLVEAQAYFDNRLDVAAWTEASDPQKSQALVTAASYLEDLSWEGEAISESQALSFPRQGYYFDPRLGFEVDLSSDAALKRLANGQCELAYHLLNNDGLLDDVGSVQNLSIGSIQLTKISGASKIPKFVLEKIRPMLKNGGTRAWWRAN